MLVAGRYALHRRIASGGMASVYYGRSFGAEGFSRVVAIKRLHPELATDSAFVAALLDEARLTSRIRHPNVVPVLDVVASGDELWVVMEYVHGEKLSTLIRRGVERRQQPPLPVTIALISDVLRGLHAAHEATSPSGESLSIVHRDVSPQNVLVSSEGVALVADFGIAKAVGRSQTTREGQIKGKLAYMAYEQLSGGEVDRRTDVWAATTVLWELITGERLFSADSDALVYSKIMQHAVIAPRERVPHVPPELDAIVMRGLSRLPADRPSTALELARELESIVRPATRTEVAHWVGEIAGDVLVARAREVAEIERGEPASSLPETTAAAESASVESTQVSTGVARPAPARRSRTLPLLGAFAVLLGIAALAVFAWPVGSGEPVERALPSAAERAPSVELALEPLASASPPPPASVVTPAPDASAPPPEQSAPARRPHPAKPPLKREQCRVLGADGIWRIRPGCL